MSSEENSRGPFAILNSPDARREALWWTLAALSVPVAGAAVWWVSENTINRLAPREVRSSICCFMRLIAGETYATLFKGSSCYHFVNGPMLMLVRVPVTEHARLRLSCAA
jgi:hypothetical protein